MCSIPAYGYKRHPSIKNKLNDLTRELSRITI